MVKKIAPHVPVGAPAVQPSAAISSILVDINIAAAELLTRFLSSVTSIPPENLYNDLLVTNSRHNPACLKLEPIAGSAARRVSFVTSTDHASP